MTSRDLSDKLDSKPLGKFGSRSIRRPVSEGRAKANADDAALAGLAELRRAVVS